MTEEVLVFLPAGDDKAPVRARVGRAAIQSAGARLFIVAPAIVTGESDLRPIRNETELGALAEDLSEAEQLFARAFLARSDDTVEERPGEGLPWDSPGYDAP
ncbi:MAG: hypothetical protein B7Z02_15370 [Rhodobacterales bacterium 32-67-9]|nr:MAG: hypothetical protein B7Z02_15370 [Rhodobacterales bacterium 32-67-9]